MSGGSAIRRIDLVLLSIVLFASGLRLQLAHAQPFIHDESNTSIPLSNTISFGPDRLQLPLRGENHGALPAYVVKASSTIFGTSPLGYRMLHLLLSLVTIVLVYRLARDWAGPSAGRWAAALLAFNEYYLAVSARATAHVPYLLFVTIAVYAFSRFLAAQRPGYLYLAGVASGLAFYCKEHAVLLLPIFLVMLLRQSQRRWLRGPHAYAAAAVFILIVAPDVYWNMTTDRETARATYGATSAAYATYGSHLERVGGLGFSPYPAMFYAQTPIVSTYRRIAGQEPRNEVREYPSMNPAIGLLLFGGVVLATFAPRRHTLDAFLLLMFWGVFGFFTLIRPGNPPGRLDPVSWIWVEATIIPAVILTAGRLVLLPRKWAAAVWAFGGAVLLYASAGAALEVVNLGIDAAQRSIDAGRHALDTQAVAAVSAVRQAPLRAIALAAVVGGAIGWIVGCACGWVARDKAARRATTRGTRS